MYLPQQFNHPEHARNIILENPFASLISNDDEGFPFVSHIPIKLMPHATDAQLDILLGHVAKGNPHAGLLYKRPEVLLTFMGPQAYMSPAVYPDLIRVPTWSYVAVHVKAEVRILEGEEAKDALLKQLIADHEPAYAKQWRGLPETYTHPMMNAIVAFEMKLLKVQTKVKLNQHRPEAHAAMHAAYDAGKESEKALALWMRRLGLVS
ncbi:MAG: FMN-binding negative transcriptional regulator [Limnohabitans sp.]|nr:FMN-binding negative transcriptional regulator [Limnohabitans sp.]